LASSPAQSTNQKPGMGLRFSLSLIPHVYYLEHFIIYLALFCSLLTLFTATALIPDLIISNLENLGNLPL
jgi:DMSO/TMAO reductase YedYZ heme-binding membrane subunit